GERAKLALAVFECENGNFLILDEPTNHLDLPARESLEEALKQFDGSVLFVSHDRYFIQALAGKIVELSNGSVTEFKGGYEEYNAYKTALKEAAEKAESASRSPAPAKQKEAGYRTKEERAAETKKRLRIKEIEETISALESEENDINEQLTSPEVTGNYTLLSEKCKRLEEVKNALDELYSEYETLI
ncbi:MAG: ABC-F family ATP-binding cassette domain-containing protein, partial [Firmicutes bacterium]|nr:ABC-F family ATP-binding cassette domain-containing protein [Bacillota bacterium]